MNKTQRKKAVAIAKDVLQQIKFLNVRTGVYMQITGQGLLKEEDAGKSLQDFIPKILESKRCNVCALGACFVSHVKLYNHFDVDEGLLGGYGQPNTKDMFKLLVESLGRKNMLLIETAFERTDMTEGHLETEGIPTYVGDPKREKYIPYAQIVSAIAFGKKYEKAPKRLAAIMRNVIRNDGEFTMTPSKKHIKQAESQIEYNNLQDEEEGSF